MLARGEPFIVHPREVAKCTAAYNTDPEILLGCIIVSGTLDTARILRVVIRGSEPPEDERAAFEAFRRVWHSPTDGEREDVLTWAVSISGAAKQRQSFRWSHDLPYRP